MNTLGISIILATLWGLAYGSVRTIVWILIIPVLFISLQLINLLSAGIAVPCWTVYAIFLFFHLMPNLRRNLITKPILRTFRSVMPAISKTEQEALNAGSVWWDRELFYGRPDWQQLLRHPPCRLSPREQAFLDGPVQTLCDHLDDWRVTHLDQDLPAEIWDFIKQSGMFGMVIPTTYGGLGFSAYAHSQVVMKIASRSITAAVTVMVPNSLGPAKLILNYGTDEQKECYLRRLACGEEIPCFALTGPKAGSDASSMPDRGVVTLGEHNGKHVLGICLNCNKRYITLAPVATLIGLAFKLEDPDHLLGEDIHLGITLALIPRETPGISIGQRHMLLNIPFQSGPISGQDVFIPLDWVIGGPAGVGQGWRMVMDALAEGRGISLPALSTAGGKITSRYTGAYAAVRRQFGLAIGDFEGVEEALARIAGLTYQMDAARKLTLSALDSGENPPVISAIVKYHLTERFRQLVNDAMDIQGGSGICLGSDNILGRTYQAIPIAITVEGANILTRSVIIFGQGSIRCHPYLLKEFTAAQNQDPIVALHQFDDALFGHAGFLIGNFARTLWLGITHGRLSRSPVEGSAKRYYQRLNWMSAAFSLTADIALLSLGGALKRKERLSARLGDLLSELYIASATLKRFHEEGSRESDLPLMQWAMDDSLYRMQHALRELLRNLPTRPLAWLLRVLSFPTGLPFSKPTDILEHQVARLILQPGEIRDHLTQGIYTTKDRSQRIGLLEQALLAVTEAAPINKTLRQARCAGQLKSRNPSAMIDEAIAIGILNESDREKLQKAEQLCNQVIQVNAYEHLNGVESTSQQTVSHASRPDQLGIV
jgi:acyl-CoA dehydrogenase